MLGSSFLDAQSLQGLEMPSDGVHDALSLLGRHIDV